MTDNAQNAPNTQSVQTNGAAPTQAITEGQGSTTVKGNASGYSSQTTINSMAELKEKAPEVYQKTLEGIAMNITNRMRRHQERLKKLMREASNK